jgi:hypothetical protein
MTTNYTVTFNPNKSNIKILIPPRWYFKKTLYDCYGSSPFFEKNKIK